MDISHVDASEKSRKRFLALPENGRKIPETVHETEARAITDSMNSRVGSLMEPASSPEDLPYFELAGHRLERRNHGVPNCPDIALNEKEASRTKPQAWSKEIDGQEHWFYNYPGACAEAKYLGKAIPTIDQWMEMLASVEWDAVRKTEILNMPIVGGRNALFGEFFDAGYYVELWSSSRKDVAEAYCVFVVHGHAHRLYQNSGHGMPLRFLADKE